MRFWRLLGRSLRLRCPVCGEGKLFRRFPYMYETCSTCGIRFQREPGFFLGSIYFNYGLTALVIAVVYPALLFSDTVDEKTLLWSATAFAVIFPILFFPHSRSFWLAFDQFYDPRPESKGRE